MAPPKAWRFAVEPHDLRYFLASIEAKTFSGAARLLHVRQPTPGRAVRRLEKRLGGVKLFHSATPLKLTPEGILLRDDAKVIVKQIDEIVARFRKRTAKEFSIGISRSPTAEIRDPVIEALRRAFPGLRPNLHDLSVAECLKDIADYEMDFALVVRPIDMPPNMVFKPLVTYSMCCVVCTKSHEYAKRPHMPVSQLSREPLLIFSTTKTPQYLEDLRRLLESHGVTPNIVQEYDDPEALLVGVAGNDGVGLLLESARHEARGDITWLPLKPALKKVDVGVLHRRNPSPFMQRVLAVLDDATASFRVKQTP